MALTCPCMETVLERRTNLPPVIHLTADDHESATTVGDALALAGNAGESAPIWMHNSSAERDAIFAEAGYRSKRTLLQLRAPLPTPATDLPTRSFTGGDADVDAVVALNNRAFDWHPEQGGMTAEKLRDQMTSPWFDADGFRLHWVDDRLAGFCWTKIHTEPEHLGEIYVIALDPDFTGRGLGAPMTQAGLDYLDSRGLTTAMLYVEADNTAAVATYLKLGFTTYRTDKLWRRDQP